MSPAIPGLDFLTMNGARIPLLIIYIVGFILALTTWRRHPTASLLSLIAFVLLFFASVLTAAVSWYALRMDIGMNTEQRGMMLSANSFVGVVLTVPAWVLLLIALFARRPQPPAWPPAEPEMYARPVRESGRPPGPPSEDIRR